MALIEEEMRRRGIKGVVKPVFQKGEQVGSVREYSDNCLLAMARANIPKKYGNNSLAGGGGNIQINIIQTSEGFAAAEVVDVTPEQIETPLEGAGGT